MDDFCDCSQCPHHCSVDEELVSPEGENATTTTTPASDDSSEASDEEDSEAVASAEKKVKKLKRAIRALGFKLKDTDEGIRVMM